VTPANLLVATASEAPVDPWSGVWIAQDIETLCDGISPCRLWRAARSGLKIGAGRSLTSCLLDSYEVVD
jgi:hypothetical protein